MAPISASFALLIGALLTALAINTTRLRLRHGRDRSQGALEQIRRASRAHGNTLEHGLLVLLLLFFAETHGASAAALCLLGALFVLARISYVFGMLTRPTSTPMKIGAGLTYTLEITLLSLLARALLAPAA
jgi:uncharacterized membrane protein YecN with MAPEG domain